MFSNEHLVMLLGFGLTLLAFELLFSWCLPGVGPWKLGRRFLKHNATDLRIIFYVAGLAGIIFLDILETKYDAAITAHLHYNLSHFFLQIEGSATALFQLVHPLWLTYLLSGVYLYIFPIMGFVAVLVTYYQEEYDLTRKLFWGAILNYLFILPFYIFVPVAERWSVGGGQVTLLMNQISPLLIDGLRPLSGLNNCFPSFHTSLAFTFAMIVSQSRNKRLRRTMSVLAWLVLYSTLYLGIHWVLDVFGGLIFAAMCTVMATWAVENLALETILSRAR